MSEDMSERRSEDMPDRSQKICQTECQEICQNECQKECQKIFYCQYVKLKATECNRFPKCNSSVSMSVCQNVVVFQKAV